jgi:D-beta-D-heptose 7-phosphate kinase/D-beta-D-heptose 1-phosphate adenosyltransferase
MDQNILSIVDRFSGLRVLVVGEAILESYIRGNADRLSLEAPAPVIGVQAKDELPGGAANTAINASKLGAQVTFLSVIGKDQEGEAVLDALRAHGISVEHVLRRPDRQTLLRRRIYAGARLMVRYDQGSRDPVGAITERRLLNLFGALCAQVDVIILSDYGAGLFTPHLLKELGKMQETLDCLMVADTRRLPDYHPLRLAALRPTDQSARNLLLDTGNGYSSSDQLARLVAAGQNLFEMIDTNLIAITLDDDGALVLERDYSAQDGSIGSVYHTHAPEMPFNRVDGAGDAFVSGLALAIAAGANAAEAAEIASAMASLVVKNGGQSTCCIEEVKAYLSGNNKMVSERSLLAERVTLLRQQGKKVVFTNGCFDILHSAHVGYLHQAKSYGDVLIIGVNTDESVKRLKGADRPINALDERSKVLAGLSCVDFVIPFDEDTPIALIEAIRPDVYVKGGDYTLETLPEAPVVAALGGTVQIVPYVENHSTTGVIERIRQLYTSG